MIKKKLLELAVIFLGGKPPRGIYFHAPGAMHHARLMAKAIYSIKILLFRKAFLLTTTELNGMRDVCIFIIRLYIKA